jgi:hypothetical protein
VARRLTKTLEEIEMKGKTTVLALVMAITLVALLFGGAMPIEAYAVWAREESTSEDNPPPTAGIDFETRKQAIIARYQSAKRSYFGAIYDTIPSARNPYSIGKVTGSYLNDGLKMFNFYRFLAGIPDDVTLDESLIYRAQHGAVLLAASGVIGHELPKPADMSQEFYQEAYASTTSSNVSYYWGATSYGSTTIDTALSGQMNDEDEGNIDRIGHRRWILSYQLKKTAFGVADANNARFFTVQVFDDSRTETNDPDYTLWPNETAFPSFVFKGDVPWSVQLSRSRYQEPTLDDVTVVLTRAADSKSWTFTKNDINKSGKYFNINSGGYGSKALPYCIIFRPSGIESYSGRYNVSVLGLKYLDGETAPFDYTVEFFEMDAVDSEGSNPTGGSGGGSGGDGEGGGGCDAGIGGIGTLLVGLFLASSKKRR